MMVMAATAMTVSKEEILELFRESDEPFLTAPEIAEEFDSDRQSINYRLKKLHSRKLVERKEAGSRAVGWWLSED